MFGNIDCRAAIFAAQRQALQRAQHQQHDRRGDAGLFEGGQQADAGGRAAHHRDGDQERIFAAHLVPEPAEHQRAQRPEEEADGKGEQAEKELGCGVASGKEQFAQQAGEDAVEEEIIPFEHGAQRAGHDHQPIPLGIDHVFDSLNIRAQNPGLPACFLPPA